MYGLLFCEKYLYLNGISKVEPGGELIIKNKGRIKKNKHLTIAQGAKMRIVNGVINQ